jgi:Response regulator containing CheY-like receiver, AAA-type ATPase, and DNA-binding domains
MTDLSGLTALVVEDQYLIALDLESHLRAIGFGDVLLAGNGAEAMDAAATSQVAVALLDMGLEEQDESLHLAEWFAQQGLRFIVVTGYGDEFAQGHPFYGRPVVRKPYNVHELTRAVAQVLEGAN